MWVAERVRALHQRRPQSRCVEPPFQYDTVKIFSSRQKL